VVSVYVDRGGQLWLGTWGGGLLAWDPRKESFRRYRKRQTTPRPGLRPVWTVYEDRRRNLWVGTTFGGLHRLDPGRDTFRRFTYDGRDPGSVSSNFIVSLCEDSRGTLWVGTDGQGLNALPPGAEAFTRYRHTPGAPGISNNFIHCLLRRPRRPPVDRHQGRPQPLRPRPGRFRTYGEKDGLPGDVVYGILEDDGATCG
jgi:hypothetical protein